MPLTIGFMTLPHCLLIFLHLAAQVLHRNCRFLQAPPGKQRAPSAASAAIRRALDGGRAKGVRLLNYKKDGTPVFNDLCAFEVLD